MAGVRCKYRLVAGRMIDGRWEPDRHLCVTIGSDGQPYHHSYDPRTDPDDDHECNYHRRHESDQGLHVSYDANITDPDAIGYDENHDPHSTFYEHENNPHAVHYGATYNADGGGTSAGLQGVLTSGYPALATVNDINNYDAYAPDGSDLDIGEESLAQLIHITLDNYHQMSDFYKRQVKNILNEGQFAQAKDAFASRDKNTKTILEKAIATHDNALIKIVVDRIKYIVPGKASESSSANPQQVADLKRELGNEEAKSKRLEGELQAASQSVTTIVQERDQLETEKKDLENKLQSAGGDNAKLKTDLQKKQKEIDKKTIELKDANKAQKKDEKKTDLQLQLKTETNPTKKQKLKEKLQQLSLPSTPADSGDDEQEEDPDAEDPTTPVSTPQSSQKPTEEEQEDPAPVWKRVLAAFVLIIIPVIGWIVLFALRNWISAGVSDAEEEECAETSTDAAQSAPIARKSSKVLDLN